MLRVGEGFNLARVNQASLIDEPAPPTESRARHERARAMSPWAMGGKRWEEPESRDRMGTWVPPVPLPAARRVTWVGESAATYTTGSSFPAGAKYPGSQTSQAFTNKLRSTMRGNGRQAMR